MSVVHLAAGLSLHAVSFYKSISFDDDLSSLNSKVGTEMEYVMVNVSCPSLLDVSYTPLPHSVSQSEPNRLLESFVGDIQWS